MLTIGPVDYDTFKQIVDGLHNVSIWYNSVSQVKIVGMGTDHGLPITVIVTPASVPATFTADFPDAFDLVSVGLMIDGTSV